MEITKIIMFYRNYNKWVQDRPVYFKSRELAQKWIDGYKGKLFEEGDLRFETERFETVD